MKHWNVKYPNRFNLDSNEDYLKWRDEKLAAYPKNVGELVVELGDMTAITAAEKTKILETVERANMCVYTAGAAELEMDALLALGKQLGVANTDKSARHAQSDELTDSGILNRAIPFSTRHCQLAHRCHLLRFGQNHPGAVSAMQAAGSRGRKQQGSGQ